MKTNFDRLKVVSEIIAEDEPVEQYNNHKKLNIQINIDSTFK
jgi:hypothetical protein